MRPTACQDTSLGDDDDAARPCRGPAHLSALHQLQLTSNQPTSTPLPPHLIPVPDTRSHCSLPSSQESPGQLHQPRHDSILHYLKPSRTLSHFLGEVSRETCFSKTITVGQMFATRLSMLFENVGITTICRVHKHKRCKKEANLSLDNRSTPSLTQRLMYE